MLVSSARLCVLCQLQMQAMPSTLLRHIAYATTHIAYATTHIAYATSAPGGSTFRMGSEAVRAIL
jgi:hypothetical protein